MAVAEINDMIQDLQIHNFLKLHVPTINVITPTKNKKANTLK